MAAHQEITREWWEQRRSDCRLIVSQLVLSEAAAGDSEAAAHRLGVLEGIELVEVTEEARDLARSLLESRVIPVKAAEDALGGERFFDTEGKHLSNHEPQWARIGWERID